MSRSKRILIFGILALFLLAVVIFRKIDTDKNFAFSPSKTHTDYISEEPVPRYIFFFIGDGVGVNHWNYLESYIRWKNNEDLDFRIDIHQMPVFTTLSTAGYSNRIPDSGAAGTMLATGEVGKNKRISLGKDGTKYISILTALQEKGMRTGLATDASITHATPATFGANVSSRNDQMEIAEHYLSNRINFLAGGGLRYFLPKELGGKRQENDNLLTQFSDANYLVQTDLKDFLNADLLETNYYLGLFADKKMPSILSQRENRMTPTLAEFVHAGIDVLSNGEDGFFFMVEGGNIDLHSHDNNTIEVLYQMIDFYDAVQVVLEFYYQNPDETLIIIASDHETGGLSFFQDAQHINFEFIENMAMTSNCEMDFVNFNEDWDELFNVIELCWEILLSDADKTNIIYQYENFDFATLLKDLDIKDDTLNPDDIEGMGHMLNVLGHILTPILFDEALVTWTSQKHTDEKVPLAVIGVGHENFSSAQHLTDVAHILAEMIGVRIGANK